QPISARTARILAADAHIIPQVLGGDSAVLDQGVGKRLFTTAQKLALAERDGGCAVTNCPQPPAHTEAHHIDWWARDDGPTDLANGILLCTHDHHMVHRQGGDIRVIDNVPWFIPPANIDSKRTPRRGGRIPTPIAPSTTRTHYRLSA
ncbi:MAG: HNH endonuclease, partial [Burkholderiaceae bacterium]|nr:HNH endonuclease [Microbacteriaceae bacterium]